MVTVEASAGPETIASACLICGSTDNLTVEHVVPQALWRRFGLDPNDARLARYRAPLCDPHNQATGSLHQRTAVLDLIEKGEPTDKRTLGLLADWAIWVTLLLGLATGEGVMKVEEAKRLLGERFGGENGGGTPRGVRVYAARVSEYARDTAYVSHMIGVEHDQRIELDHAGKPAGFSVRSGPITSSEAIGLGKVALLVLGRTYSSGSDHEARLDSVAATVGLERIHPPQPKPPAHRPRPVDITAATGLFVSPPFGTDSSLLPSAVRATVELLVPPSPPS